MLIHQGPGPSPILMKNHKHVSQFFFSNLTDILPPISVATTVQDVRLELVNEEAEEAARGILTPHKTSLSGCLTLGLELEEQQ
jgi:hypothetical protein